MSIEPNRGMSISERLNSILAMESKERRVRTAAGVDRFKQPINSIIVADVVPNAISVPSGVVYGDSGIKGWVKASVDDEDFFIGRDGEDWLVLDETDLVLEQVDTRAECDAFLEKLAKKPAKPLTAPALEKLLREDGHNPSHVRPQGVETRKAYTARNRGAMGTRDASTTTFQGNGVYRVSVIGKNAKARIDKMVDTAKMSGLRVTDIDHTLSNESSFVVHNRNIKPLEGSLTWRGTGGASVKPVVKTPPASVPADSKPRKEYRVPKKFYDDHVGRADNPSVAPPKSSGAYYSVNLTKEEYDDLLSDADYYADGQGSGDFDPSLNGLLKSAAATLKALRESGPPSSETVAATPKSGGDGSSEKERQFAVEVDTKAAEIYEKLVAAQSKMYQEESSIRRLSGQRSEYIGRSSNKRWVGTFPEALESLTRKIADAKAANSRTLLNQSSFQTVDDAERAISRYNSALAVVNRHEADLAVQEAIYAKRRWNRAFLVIPAVGMGHVHKSRACSTTYPTTQWAWLPEYSGSDESRIVSDAGERACTICYPSAPVGTLDKPTKIYSKGELSAIDARKQRDEERAQKLAEKISKAATKNGDELVITLRGYRESFKTERSAMMWAVGAFGGYNEPREEELAGIMIVAESIAEKRGVNISEVLQEIQDKGDAKRKKDYGYGAVTTRLVSGKGKKSTLDRIEAILETKERRVRTPEGRDRFNKPIGAIIDGVADTIPDIPVKPMDYSSIRDNPPMEMIDGRIMFVPRNSPLDMMTPGYVPKEPYPVEWVYRAISEAEWDGILKNGYMKSDERMNVATGEGTVAATRDPTFYLPPNVGERGRVVKFKYDPEDNWRVDSDGYLKTDSRIPIERFDSVSDWYIAGTPAAEYTHDDLIRNSVREMGNIVSRLRDDYRGPNADFRDEYYKIQDKISAKRYDDIETLTRHVYTADEFDSFIEDLEQLVRTTESEDGRDLTTDLIARAKITKALIESKPSHRMSHQPDLDGPSVSDIESLYPGIYENPEWYSTNEKADRESLAVINKVRGKPDATVTVYRAVPQGVTTINPGDWVSLSRTYATEHGMHATDAAQDMPVISMEVPARFVVEGSGNSINEWGYQPVEDAEIDTKTLFERFHEIEEKVRNVVDSEYWGMPVDTPITPGMKPKKKKASDYVPSIVGPDSNGSYEVGINGHQYRLVFEPEEETWRMFEGSKPVSGVYRNKDQVIKLLVEREKRVGEFISKIRPHTPKSIRKPDARPYELSPSVYLREYIGADTSFWGVGKSGHEYESLDTLKKELFDAIAAKEFSLNASRPILIDVTVGSLLKIIANRRMKNAHEADTGSKRESRSSYMRKRNEYERKIMGVPSDTPASKKPIYGYSKFDAQAKSGWYNYGSVKIRLKDRVKGRSTMSAGDSLDGKVNPVWMSDVLDGNISSPEALWHASSEDYRWSVREVVDGKSKSTYTDYWEVQIHGGVTLEDIDSIEMNESDYLKLPAAKKKVLEDSEVQIWLV